MATFSRKCQYHPLAGLAGALLCLLLGSTPVLAQAPLETVTLQLKGKHAFRFAGYYAAIEQGYYADAGFDVALRELTDERSPADFLLYGEADYAITGSEIVIHRASGAPLVALATLFQHSPDGLLVRSETDAFSAFVTDQQFLLQEQVIDGDYILSRLDGTDLYSNILVTTEAHIAAGPERVQAFRDASLKGWKYALDHTDELIDLVLARYDTQGFSRAQLREAAQSSREMILPLFVPLGYMNPERWEHIRKVFEQQGVLPPDSRIDGILYNETASDLRLAQWLVEHRVPLSAAGGLLLALLSWALLQSRRQVEQRTRELAENQRQAGQQHLQLQKLLDTINGISWEFDLAQNRFTLVSENLKRLLGYSHGSMSSMDDWLNMIVEEDREAARTSCINETEAGRDHVFEYRMRKQNGEIISVLDVVRVLKGKDGTPVQLTGFIVDVTERKLAENALRRAQKMDAVGQLTGGIAHDFNNILGIIQGNVDMMLQQLDDPVLLQGSIDNLQKTTQRAVKLTQQLLDISRARSDHAEASDLNYVIEQTRELTAGSLTPEITIRYELERDLWFCKIDIRDFQNALVNLVLNACDAMPHGGELVVRTGNISIARNTSVKTGTLQSGDYVLLSVTDSGVGIPSAQLERIFEPFFTTKDVGMGSGLGLPVVFGFVQRAGGQIDVDTFEGSGTSFTLYLQRTTEVPQPREETPVQVRTRGGERERVLVVDDEPALLKLTAMRLARKGYHVVTANDGHSALAALEREPDIDLLFTDVVMPGGMNGYALADCAESRYPALKVLMTTGFTPDRPGDEAQLRNRRPVLHKPYAQQVLLDRIREVLDATV